MARFLTGLVGVIIFVTAILLWFPVMPIVVLLFIVMALTEMVQAMRSVGINIVPYGAYITVALLWPAYLLLAWEGMLAALVIGVLVTLAWPKNIKRSFQDVSASVMLLVYPVLPLAFLLFTAFMPMQEGRLVIGWGLGISFFMDTMAYYSGSLFGKHQLAPNISPKKTIEGAAGALICAILAAVPVGLWLQGIYTGTVWYVYVIAAIICGMGAMVGDLTASVIKRQLGIKDFGKLLPGHGGILDRFDSIMFALPLTFILVKLYALVTPLVLP